MLLIPCPWCGERDETEFHCGGEAHIARPKEPASLSDDQWADYLFMRNNPKGIHYERWRHLHGVCVRIFDTAKQRFRTLRSRCYSYCGSRFSCS